MMNHNTRPKTRGDHTACYIAGAHPKTPAGRAECRKARMAPAPMVAKVPMDFTCPSCGVGPVIPCRTKSGRATATHAARKALV